MCVLPRHNISARVEKLHNKLLMYILEFIVDKRPNKDSNALFLANFFPSFIDVNLNDVEKAACSRMCTFLYICCIVIYISTSTKSVMKFLQLLFQFISFYWKFKISWKAWGLVKSLGWLIIIYIDELFMRTVSINMFLSEMNWIHPIRFCSNSSYIQFDENKKIFSFFRMI